MISFVALMLLVVIVASFAAGYLAGRSRWKGWEE